MVKVKKKRHQNKVLLFFFGTFEKSFTSRFSLNCDALFAKQTFFSISN